MKTAARLIAQLKLNYEPGELVVASIWDEGDVEGLEEEHGWKFTHQERAQILSMFKENEDPTIGLNWTTLEKVCQEVLAKRAVSA